MISHWLLKSEPTTYPWSKLVSDGRATWDGVRNFEARNNLRAMKAGDLALFYHSNEGKQIVGVARIVRAAYQDPTSDGDWSAVDIAPLVPLRQPVDLAAIKADPALAQMQLIRKSRISVVPVTKPEFQHLLKQARTRLPAG